MISEKPPTLKKAVVEAGHECLVMPAFGGRIDARSDRLAAQFATRSRLSSIPRYVLAVFLRAFGVVTFEHNMSKIVSVIFQFGDGKLYLVGVPAEDRFRRHGSMNATSQANSRGQSGRNGRN